MCASPRVTAAAAARSERSAGSGALMPRPGIVGPRRRSRRSTAGRGAVRAGTTARARGRRGRPRRPARARPGSGGSRRRPAAARAPGGAASVATPGSGASPCSRKCSVPPGRSTRRTSARAAAASGIVHSANVDSTASYDCVRLGQVLAVQAAAPHRQPRALAAFLGEPQPTSAGSTAPSVGDRRRQVRQVQPAAEADLQHPAVQPAAGGVAQPADLVGVEHPVRSGAARRARSTRPSAPPPVGAHLGATVVPPSASGSPAAGPPAVRAASVGSRHERAPGDGHRGRVRHLGARPAAGQPDGGLVAGRQRLRLRHRAGPPGPVGLRGGVAAARRPRLRHVAPGRRPQPAHRRGPRAGQRHPHQRRPALRRPRPPGVLHARGAPARSTSCGGTRRGSR